VPADDVVDVELLASAVVTVVPASALLVVVVVQCVCSEVAVVTL
jgi:hypothetical protein